MGIHINKVFRDNYDAIKSGTYEWKDEDVENVYELVNYFLNKNEIEINGYTREDLVQELVMEFFMAVRRYDKNNFHPLTVYLTRVFRQRCTRLLNDSLSIDVEYFRSMDNFIDENVIDYETKIIKEEIMARFIELNKDKPFIIDYFLVPGMTLEKIGKEYGVTRSRIQQHVAKALREARVDKKIVKLGCN